MPKRSTVGLCLGCGQALKGAVWATAARPSVLAAADSSSSSSSEAVPEVFYSLSDGSLAHEDNSGVWNLAAGKSAPLSVKAMTDKGRRR